MYFIKDTPDGRNVGRLTWRQEKLDAVEPPLLDARKQRRMSFAHMRGPHHGIHAVFHVLNPLWPFVRFAYSERFPDSLGCGACLVFSLRSEERRVGKECRS